jgi:hypothetical protein
VSRARGEEAGGGHESPEDAVEAAGEGDHAALVAPCRGALQPEDNWSADYRR